jgi:hypothetical protein
VAVEAGLLVVQGFDDGDGFEHGFMMRSPMYQRKS